MTKEVIEQSLYSAAAGLWHAGVRVPFGLVGKVNPKWGGFFVYPG
jgi:hypothetical protein